MIANRTWIPIALLCCVTPRLLAQAPPSDLHAAAERIVELSLAEDPADRAAGQALLENSSRKLLLEVNRVLLARLQVEAPHNGPQILVEATVFSAGATLLEELGIELPARAAGETGDRNQSGTLLEAALFEQLLAAVTADPEAQVLSSPRLLVLDREEASITVTDDVAYISDYEVEESEGKMIATPIVSTIQDGFTLHLRPELSAGGTFLTLDANWTVSDLVRPIAEIQVSVGDDPSVNPVTIQLPELTIQRIKASFMVVVDAGSVVLLYGPPAAHGADSVGNHHMIALRPEVLQAR